MNIYPQDLGRIGYRVMLHLRTQAGESADHAASNTEEPLGLARLTFLRRAWVRGSGVSENIARHAPPAFADCRRAIWRGTPGLAGTLFWSLAGIWFLEAAIASVWNLPQLMHWLYASWLVAGAGEVYYAVTLRPRRSFRRLHDPLTEEDVRLLIKQVRDPLARDFLAVVELLLPLPALADAEGQKNLRQALYALGEAIEELPQQSPAAVQSDPVQIRDQAARLQDLAQCESDSVVAASLERRAQSLARRAQTVGSIAVLLRRNQTLREEVSEQIEALRTGIAALSVGSHQSAHELAELAASIQRVAEEAGAIAVAQTELETLMTEPHSEAEPARLVQQAG